MDVAVIGGGVIGLAVAWRAAQRGMSVLVADPAPGGGASHVAAGMIAPVGEAHFGETALLELALDSWRRYPAFIAELESASGCLTGYWECGTLLVARDRDDIASLERDHRYRESLQLPAVRVRSQECLRLEPGLAPSIRGGIVAAGDHQVDPRMLVQALMAACTACGVELVRSRASVTVDGGRATGIRLDGGRAVSTGTVVLSAGCWSATVEGVPGDVIPPVRPVKGQLLRLAGPAPAPVGRVVRGLDVYLVPRADGALIVGSTVEERGFDTTVTAGAVHQLLGDARELVPDIAEMQLVEVLAGLRPATPDNAPLIGWSRLPGLLMATGHHRNGVLLAPATAGAAAELLSGEAVGGPAAPFAPSRFDARSPVPA